MRSVSLTTTNGHIEYEGALVEMMIRHRNRQSSGEPDGEFHQSTIVASSVAFVAKHLTGYFTEILEIVHQSLRKKVNSLDDDNWMFEPEKDARL